MGLSKVIEDKGLNICDGDALNKVILNVEPDFVFHLAAQSLVSESYINPVETYKTNVLGTLNLLEALKNLKKNVLQLL